MKHGVFFVALAVAGSAAAGPVPESNIESIVKIYVVDPYGRQLSWGSGTVIDADGDILTNYHVVSLALTHAGFSWRVYPTSGAKSAPVEGAELATTLVGSAPHLDLALLRATQIAAPTAATASSTTTSRSATSPCRT